MYDMRDSGTRCVAVSGETRLHREHVLGTSEMPDVTAGALRRGPGGLQVLSYAKDHTSALFQQAKEREERLREEGGRRDQGAPKRKFSAGKSGMSMVRW